MITTVQHGNAIVLQNTVVCTCVVSSSYRPTQHQVCIINVSLHVIQMMGCLCALNWKSVIKLNRVIITQSEMVVVFQKNCLDRDIYVCFEKAPVKDEK